MNKLKIGDAVVLKKNLCHAGQTGCWTVVEFSGPAVKLQYVDGDITWASRQDFKMIDPNAPLPICLRTSLPYGMWTCADGREVLFNRNYKPIWQRIDGVVTAADPDEWVLWVSQQWLFDDCAPPWVSIATRRRCETVLVEWAGGPEAKSPWRFGVALDAEGRTTVVLERTEPSRRARAY
jgi:hypothetical protein